MINPHIPNWLRIILAILSILSFIPQVHRIHSSKSSGGLSLGAILANLIVATEQFTIFFYILVNEYSSGPRFYTNDPPNAGDWINLVQTTVVWICFLIQFILGIYYSTKRRLSLVVTYVAFLLISIALIIFDLIQWKIDPDWEKERMWLVVLFYGYHSIFLFPIIYALGIVAVYRQARLVLRSPDFPGAWSIRGLELQAIMFSLIALSWVWRIPFPWEEVEYPTFQVFQVWSSTVGWVAVDNGIFAVGQALLLLLAKWRRRKTEVEEGTTSSDLDETEPLLAGGEGRGYASVSP
ncbi:hypothetical protein BDV12DRAFT_131373 [Aspergillus spectabilis]